VFYFIAFLFGASIGSFVQVIVTRLNVAPIVKTRSKCLSCGEALRAYDLVPIFSYFFLGGKCRYCKSSYGVSTLLIEALYGCVFLALYQLILAGHPSLFLSGLWLIYYTVLFIVMGVIALYDMKHTYIPFLYLLAYAVLSLVMLLVRYNYEPSPLHLLAPFAVALPFLTLYLITRGRGVGFGDVVLFLGVGAFFGIAQGYAVLLLSVWMGALVGICMYLFNKNKKTTLSTALPFVPFIVIAFLIVLFTDINIFSIASLFA
jgi:leader peptidase (prepilin peptidase)/N-methyltransferase